MALPVDPVIGELYTIGDYLFEYMGDGVFQRKDILELEIPETEVSDIVELVSEDNTGHPVTTDTVLRISINGVEYEINAKTVV